METHRVVHINVTIDPESLEILDREAKARGIRRSILIRLLARGEIRVDSE